MVSHNIIYGQFLFLPTINAVLNVQILMYAETAINVTKKICLKNSHKINQQSFLNISSIIESISNHRQKLISSERLIFFKDIHKKCIKCALRTGVLISNQNSEHPTLLNLFYETSI